MQNLLLFRTIKKKKKACDFVRSFPPMENFDLQVFSSRNGVKSVSHRSSWNLIPREPTPRRQEEVNILRFEAANSLVIGSYVLIELLHGGHVTLNIRSGHM